MEPVIQEEISGCGIAACAALAGVSYIEAKQVANNLGIFAEDRALWSDTAYVRALLEAFKLSTSPSETPFESWDALPDRVLLSIKWRLEMGRPFWHWVVFARQNGCIFVLDSKKGLKSNIRQDFGRMKPKWYIEVHNNNSRQHAADGRRASLMGRRCAPRQVSHSASFRVSNYADT